MITLLRKFQGVNYRRYITGANFVIFNGASNGRTLKYSIPDDLTVVGTSFALTRVAGGCSAGNATYGLFVAGQSAATQATYKYAYSNDVITTGAVFGVETGLGTTAAAGNASLCLVAIGTLNFAGSQVVRKYVYAGDVVSNGTSLTFSSDSMLESTSTGNAQFGLFRYNFRSGVTDRFEFASDTRTAGAVVGSFTSVGTGSHTGNGEIGLMTGSPANRVNKITFASNTSAVGTNLPVARQTTRSMCGTTVTGVFGAGGTSQPCALYNYASDTTANAAADFNAVGGTGVCANPVGVNV